MKRLVTFGEVLMRLSAPRGQRFAEATSFDAHVGGAEANVATLLACLGWRTRLLTLIPTDGIGELALNKLEAAGVEISHTCEAGLLGSYFHEYGTGTREARIRYNRASSAFARWHPIDVDWADELAGADWLHLSGITPALSAEAARAQLEGMRAARALGVPVSFDVNYRPLLWNTDVAAELLATCCALADVLFTNERDAALLWGIEERGEDLARALAARFPNLRHVVVSLHEEAPTHVASRSVRPSFSASKQSPRAGEGDTVHRGAGELLRDEWHTSPIYAALRADDVGAGDAQAAAWIHAACSGWAPDARARFAAAAACMKMRIAGDALHASEEDLLRMVEASGPVGGAA